MTAPEPTRPADEHTDAVALDLDALARRYSTATDDEVIYEMYPALEAEVRRLTGSLEIVHQRLTDPGHPLDSIRFACQHIYAALEGKSRPLALATARAEAAEAAVVTLRAKVAAVEALVNNGQTVGWIERDGDVAWIAADAVRAALATTGEGE